MTIWDKNCAIIKEKHPQLLPLNPPDSFPDFFLKDSKFGLPVPGVKENQKKNLLGSIYKKEASIEPPAGYCLTVLFGSMNILNQEDGFLKHKKIILIEPKRDLFLYFLKHFDLETFLNHQDLKIFIGASLNSLKHFLQNSYSPYLDGKLNLYVHGPSNRIFYEKYLPGLTLIETEKEKWLVEWTTQKHFSKNWFRNILHNLHYRDDSLSIEIPNKVIILAAGPSIEEVLTSERFRKEKAKIVAVDTLLPLLVEYNIPVDWVISMDCQISSYHHYLKGCPAPVNPIMDIAVHNVLPRKAGKVFFTGNPHPLVQLLCPELPVMNTGLGNVTAFAVDAMIKLGAEEIEIYGADFSYPRGKAYSRGTYLINHFLYHSDRLDTQEHKMYDFSSRSCYPRENGQRTTARLENYKKSLLNYIERLAPLSLTEKNGHWSIRLSPQSEIKTTSLPPKQERLSDFKKRLESIDVKNLKYTELKERECLATLFPLLTLYLDENSWEEAVEKARNWALDQIEAIEA